MSDAITIGLGFIEGFLSSSAFVVVIFIGFCVVLGFTKTRKTTGNAPVVKNLDEAVNHQTAPYFAPSDPRGPADQLRSPELVEAAARK